MDKKMSWEEAVSLLQNLKEYEKLIYRSYLSRDLIENCERFYSSKEYLETQKILKNEAPKAKKVLDLAAGNGIATYAFSMSGYDVTALEPDGSLIVGRGGIEKIKNKMKLSSIKIIDGYGEDLPFVDNSFDVVYVRQALHHANNLSKMLIEISRVLKVNGLFIATREHVIDNYGAGLKKFLSQHPVHRLYGGENAFLLQDYINAIKNAGFQIVRILKPYESEINISAGSFDELRLDILQTRAGVLLKTIFRDKFVANLGIFILRLRKEQGRLYSFIAKKV